MVPRSQRQELEAADQTAVTVRKQREKDTGAQLTLSFDFSPGPQTMGSSNVPLHWFFLP